MWPRRETHADPVQPDVVDAPGADHPRADPPLAPTPAEVGKTYIVLQSYHEAVIDTLASLEREVLHGSMDLAEWIAIVRARTIGNAPTVELAYAVAVEANER